jgi:hypothetical protein
VLDKEEPQLISTMESYVRNVGADLVVMATKALNTAQLQVRGLWLGNTQECGESVG